MAQKKHYIILKTLLKIVQTVDSICIFKRNEKYALRIPKKLRCTVKTVHLVKMIELIKFAIRHNWTLSCIKFSMCACVRAREYTCGCGLKQ